jgi:hypothetical protein
MIGHSNRATLDLALTGAALMKLKYCLGTDLGRRSRLQVIHDGQDDSILSAKLIRIVPETSSF